VGVLQTFLFNRRWTFAHRGASAPALARYVLIYFLGYVFQWLALWALVDRLGWPHQLVMGGLVIVTACLIFLGQKFWVFASIRPRTALDAPRG